MSRKPIAPKTGVSKPFRGAMSRYLEANPHYMDELIAKMAKLALQGNFSVAKELLDRSDGRVPYKVGGDEEGEPIEMIITGVPRDGDG